MKTLNPGHISRHTRTWWRQGIFALVASAVALSSFCQTANTYTFSTNASVPLASIAGATGMGVSGDDSQSALTPIGFTFIYEGVAYTQFSANSNGSLRLGGAVGTAYINTGVFTPTTLHVLWDDHSTAANAVQTVLNGSSGSFVRVVNFNLNIRFGTPSNLQILLYEGTNNIEFRYGTDPLSGTLTSTIAIVGANIANFISVTPPSTTSTATRNDNVTAWPGVNRSFLFTPPPPPTCPVPAVTVTAVSGSSADVSWICAGCTGTYIVEYGNAGFTPGTGATAGVGGTIISPATSPTTLFSLPSNVTNVYVRQNCGVDGFSANSPVASFQPGDVCGNALDLSSLPNPYNGNTTGFANDFSNACAFGNIGSDMVFYIDVPNNNQLSVAHASPAYDSEVNVYYGGSCPGATLIACWDDPDDQTILWTNTTGSTQRVFWVQDGWSTGTNNAGAFTLTWSLSTCPTSVSSPATNITLTSADANWTPTTGNFILEYGPAATFTTPGVDATAGANGTAVAVTTSPYTIPGLANGTQYRYFVRTDCGGGNYSPNSSPQTFTTLFPPPANDLCADAIALTCGVAVTGSTTAANNVGAPGITCGTSPSTAGGVWYTISGVCGSTTASMCTGTNYDSKLFVYTGTCGGFSCVGGNDDGCGAQSTVTWTADASTTYYLYVAGFSTATGTYGLVVNCGGSPLAATASIADDCLNGTYTVDVNISDLGSGSSADIIYVVNGGAPQTQAGAGLGVTPVGPFQLTDIVTVTVGNGAAGCGVDLGEFASSCPVTLSCGSTTTVNYCYKNNDSKSWTFISPTPGETVTLTFVSGTIDENTDIVRIYNGVDNSGTLLATSTVNSLAGLTATSTGQELYMEVDSDPAGSCQDGAQTSWLFEVECTPGCVDPDGSVVVTTDCPNYNFTIDVEILFVGDAPNGTTSISYTVNGGPATVIPGLVDFQTQNLGTFAIDDVVAIELLHESDALCNRNLGTFTDNNTCGLPSENCLSAQNLASLTSPYSSTTVGYLDDLSTYPGGCQSNTSPDRIFYIDVPNGSQLIIGQTVNGYDSENYVGYGGACPGATQIACYDDPDIQNVTWTNTTGSTQRVYWVQDGYFNATNAGTFTLAWSVSGCAAPSGVNTTLVTSAQAQVNFTGVTGNYIVEYGPAATFTTPGTGATAGVNGMIVTGTDSPIIITGLTNNTQYRYFVRRDCGVDGFSANAGPVVFTTLALPPVNDECANAIPVTCAGSPYAGTNVAATGEGLPSQASGGEATVDNGVWYVYTGDNSQVTASLCGSAFDTRLHVFSGDCLTPVGVAGNDDFCGTQSQVTFPAYSGTTYYIIVEGYFTGSGNFTLALSCSALCLPVPGNDACANAAVVTPGAFGTCETITGSMSCSAPTPGNPSCLSTFGTFSDVYYSFTAPSATANVRVSNVTSTLSGWAVYSACGGSQITCSTIFGSDVTVSGLTSGSSYVIRVLSTQLDAGSFTVCVSNGPQPPANDACANAIAVGCNSVTTGTTVLSTTVGEPGFCGTNLNSAGGVWYTIAGWDGPMTASLCGSSFDTKIGIFTGSCGAFTCVTGVDDFCGLQSQVSWTGTNGTTYYIYVTGFGTATGAFTLTTQCGDNNSLCTENGLTMEFQTDGAPFETTWEIRNEAGTVVATSGGPLVAPFGVQTESGCVPDGCYTLRVLDSAGDGMTTGGYILRTQGANQRIIDNRNNFSSGSVSAISGGQGFCLPLSNDKVIFTSCDKLDWINGQFVVASPNPAVSAEWIVGGANSVQDANSGYEFWIFDPNGSYSFRRFRSHNVSDGFGPASATRACHMKLNNWTPASQVPANTLMNVRVRARVNGVNGEFGPACRLKIDPVRAACPLTNLMDVPGSSQFSCNVIRQYGTNNYVYARPVSGANRYQFRFRLPAEGFEVVRTSTTYILHLNWTGPTALQDGKTYEVDVRVSKDAGATYCTSSDPWGNICSVTIDQTPAGSGNQNFAAEGAGELRMFPNPNRGDVLTFSLSAIEEGVNTVSVDIFDLFGKRISARTIAVTDGQVNTTLDLNGELAAGMYLVNITAGETLYTERLVIQP